MNGPATFGADKLFRIPVTIVVGNQGTRTAGPFKVSMHHQSTAGGPAYVVQFIANNPAQQTGWYARPISPLPPGASVQFSGQIVILKNWSGQSVRIWAEADSTAGEEIAPPNGHVVESNEANNASTKASIRLPMVYLGPTHAAQLY